MGDSWILGLIIVLVQTFLTTAIGTIVGLIIKAKWEKRKNEQAELEKLREETRVQEETNRCNLMKTAIHQEIIDLDENLTAKSTARHDEIKGVVEEIKNDLFLLKRGLQNNLYIDLVYIHDDYVNKQKFATRDQKRDYDNLYQAYHNLGKNGIADAMHERVMNLPEQKPTQRKPRKKKVLVENK